MHYERPLISILIANYNNVNYLRDALSSVQRQTYTNWEIIIVDDASTDLSKEVYLELKSDSRIKVYINNQNKGCGFTKRKCLEYATGDVCGFLDPDDALVPEACEIMIKSHISHPKHSLIYSTHYICDELLEPVSIANHVGQIPVHESQLTYTGPRISHFATFKRALYLQTPGISSSNTKAVDQDLYYLLEETGPVLFIDKPLYFYRHHAGSISLNENKYKAYISRLAISYQAYKRRKAGTPYAVSNLSSSEVNKRMLQYHTYQAHQHLKKKNYAAMYREIARACRFIMADKDLVLLRTALIPLKQKLGI